MVYSGGQVGWSWECPGNYGSWGTAHGIPGIQLSMDAPHLLGGHGVIVQIDESLFRHKPKVSEYNSEDKVLGLICNVF